MRPTHPYGVNYELDLIELGDRAARAYDEVHEIAYRLAAALGYARAEQRTSVLVVDLQRRWLSVRSRECV